jgi:hypothetical protein
VRTRWQRQTGVLEWRLPGEHYLAEALRLRLAAEDLAGNVSRRLPVRLRQ